MIHSSPRFQNYKSRNGVSSRSKPSSSFESSASSGDSSLATTLDPSCFAAFPCGAHRATNSSIPGTTDASFSKFPRIPDSACRRLEQTALVPHSPLGWAEISHPFHPLRGRRFEVLKKRRVAGVDTLILRELERGTFSVPRESTDWADPSPYDSLTLPPQRLAADCLFELVALLDALRPAPPPPEKTCKKELTKEMPDAAVRPVVNVVR